ncbi:MAG: DNA-formamidopyrimidine glycosylase family protein [Anaerolineales bacterium]
MPELPELEVVQEVLTRRLVGRRIQRVTIEPRGGPIVVRDLSGRGFPETLASATVEAVERQGKFLVFTLRPGPLFLAVNPKLSGRLQLCAPGDKKAGPVHVTMHFTEPEEEFRYVDRKRMGQLYLTRDLASVPTFSEMGPDALAVSLQDFADRLRAFRGEIKGILTRERFLAGIGNAYADEILWQAGIHPFRKRPRLEPDEIDRLYDSMREVLLGGIEKVRESMGDQVHLKPREFFAVHLRGGEPCPRCSTAISEITARQRITNFCRTCQPGGLIVGMGS